MRVAPRARHRAREPRAQRRFLTSTFPSRVADFFYLPRDFGTQANVGYAFINFCEPSSVVRFYQAFNGRKWGNTNSPKVCSLAYARIQGRQAMIQRFHNSKVRTSASLVSRTLLYEDPPPSSAKVMRKPDSFQPLLFYSSGELRGQPEPFRYTS